MRKLAILITVFFFVVSVMPVAGSQEAQEIKSKPKDWITIFQRASDDINKLQWKEVEEVKQFESSKNYIATWDESSAAAKSLSLRGDKGELARRRNRVLLK